MTTILTVMVAILLIVLLPLYIYVKACGEKKSKVVFVIGILISIFGVFASEWLFNTYQLFTSYQFSRSCVFWAMFVLTLGFGVLYKDSENDPDRSFALRLYSCIAVVLFVVTVFFTQYIPLENGLSEREMIMQPKDEEIEAVYQQNVEVTTYTQTERYELLSLKIEDDEEQVEKTEDSKIFIGIDRDNKILYWCFFYKNNNGTTEMCCLDGEKFDTIEIFENLESGEEPYLEIVNTVEVQTDNNYSPS